MKKIGLTISNESYETLKLAAKESKLTVSTICRLVIESRVTYWEENNYYPVFGCKYWEGRKPKDPKELEEMVRIAKTDWLNK